MTDDLRRRAIAQLVRFLEEDEKRPTREPRKDKKSVIAAKQATTERLRREVAR